MRNQQTQESNAVQEGQSHQQKRDAWLKDFADHVDLLPPVAQVAAYGMLDAIGHDESLEDRMRELLWDRVQELAFTKKTDTEKGWWFNSWRWASGQKSGQVEADPGDRPGTKEAAGEEAEPAINDLTRQRIVKFYRDLDAPSKLAILTIIELRSMDGLNFDSRRAEDDRLCDRIFTDLEESCLREFEDPEDVWLAGVWQACDMVIQGT